MAQELHEEMVSRREAEVRGMIDEDDVLYEVKFHNHQSNKSNYIRQYEYDMSRGDQAK